MSTTGDLGLYFHIPFCKKKCPYCHFFVIPDKEEHKRAFFDSLKIEWQEKLSLLQGFSIDTIYFGGGTPSLCPKEIAAFLDTIRQEARVKEGAEITLEVNPETITEELINILTAAGINRLSIGVQSFDNSSLLTLGRAHSGEKSLDGIYLAAKKIKNISIDFMFDLPNESFSSLQKNIAMVKKIPITHLSLYNLTIEPHTVFYKKKLTLPSQEKSLKHLNFLIASLEELGFFRYEISAFCKEGFHSKHNIKYWEGKNVLGFGPSATSYFLGRRFRNISHFLRYCKKLKNRESIEEYSETLSLEKRFREEICLQLRLRKGIPKKALLFSPYFPILEKEIASLIKEELLTEEKGHIKLSKKGSLFHDLIAERII